MNINELTPGTDITICILIDNMPVNLKAKAISAMNGALLVSPLKYHGVPIPASTCATAEITLYGDIKKAFNIESVVPFENWNDTYYLLKGHEVINQTNNNRKAERYVVNILGKAVINHKVSSSAIIYDISIKGVSLLLGKGVSANLGDTIKLTFKPEGHVRTIELPLTVKRQFQIGTFDAVGCKIMDIDSDMMNYVIDVKKEKDEIKKAKSNSKVIVHDESAEENPTVN